MKKGLVELLSWIRTFGLAFIIALFVSTFIVQPSIVKGSSMDPTLHDKQYIFISKIMHTLRYEPDYGDIVVIDSHLNLNRTVIDEFLDSPLITLITQNPREKHVKRVIGKAGDIIEIKNRHVYRNGQLLDEPYIKEEVWSSSNGIFEVPTDHIFVLGDNRNYSRDSRAYGFVPLSHVLGKKL